MQNLVSRPLLLRLWLHTKVELPCFHFTVHCGRESFRIHSMYIFQSILMSTTEQYAKFMSRIIDMSGGELFKWKAISSSKELTVGNCVTIWTITIKLYLLNSMKYVYGKDIDMSGFLTCNSLYILISPLT